MTRDEGLDFLGPHLHELCAPVYAAWDDWEQLTPTSRLRFRRPTTRANWLFDQMAGYATTTLDRPPLMTVTEQPGFPVVTVGGRIAVRYKKLDDTLAISGIRTDQFQMWTDQQLPIAGLGPLTHLVAGYTVSDLGRLSGVALVCSTGGRYLWHIEVPRAGMAGSDPTPLPRPTDPPPPRILPFRRPDTVDPDES